MRSPAARRSWATRSIAGAGSVYSCWMAPASPWPRNRRCSQPLGLNRTNRGSEKYPLARMATLALGNTKTVLGYALGRYVDSELALAQQLFDRLRAMDLLIA